MNIGRLQVRTLPGRRGYGLCDPGDKSNSLRNGKKVVEHTERWVGVHNAEVMSPFAALAFPSVHAAHMYRYDLAGKNYAAEQAKGKSKAAKAGRGI